MQFTLQRVLAAIAVLFGIVTVIEGSRVLAGADPGYVVFRPLLVYNTAMGLAYVAAGVLALRGGKQGLYAAGVIFILNCLMLGTISYLYASGHSVAIESLRAMTFRTVVWLVLWSGFTWVHRRRSHSDRQREA